MERLDLGDRRRRVQTDLVGAPRELPSRFLVGGVHLVSVSTVLENAELGAQIYATTGDAVTAR